MGHLDILKNIALVYCADDITLIRLDEREVANTLKALVQCVLQGVGGNCGRFRSQISEVLGFSLVLV